ncbi:MAG TPA: segregation/condensation protein A [Gammaproteobacteria bacterium]|nr:segregation/condensation protein A [Gammaproteobacteria bacterium]
MTEETVSTQSEMPFAIIQGEPLSLPPEDLYIPPDALEVILEAFEGPLDLLLYLIKRQNLDILDIPIAGVTAQYVEYIEMMDTMRLELAAEYLVMAAVLAEIKSRMLLPRPESQEEEEDPRAELVRRLQEYEQFKQAAEDMDELPRMYRDTYPVDAEPPDFQQDLPEPEIDLKALLYALKDVMKRAAMFSHHQIETETLSVRARMTEVLGKLKAGGQFVEFTDLFTHTEGRMGVVVSFLAILELLKGQVIDLAQPESFGTIYVSFADAAIDHHHEGAKT